METTHFESLYPANTREHEIAKIIAFIKEGNSCQVVSLPGGGRSNLLGLLSYNRNVRIKHLGENQKWFHFVLCNFAEIRNKPLAEAIKFLFLSLIDSIHARHSGSPSPSPSPLGRGDGVRDVGSDDVKALREIFSESIVGNDELVLFQGLKRAIDLLAIEKELTIVFLFDRFEDYVPTATPEFFTNLRVLRDRAKYRFAVVFSIHKPLEDLIGEDILLDFYQFVAGHTVYLPLLDKPGLDFRIAYMEKLSGKTLSKPRTQDPRPRSAKPRTRWCRTKRGGLTVGALGVSLRDAPYGASLRASSMNPRSPASLREAPHQMVQDEAGRADERGIVVRGKEIIDAILSVTAGHPNLTRLGVETMLNTPHPFPLPQRGEGTSAFVSSPFRGEGGVRVLTDFLLEQKPIKSALFEIWKSLTPAEQKLLTTLPPHPIPLPQWGEGKQEQKLPLPRGERTEVRVKDEILLRQLADQDDNQRSYLQNVGLIKNNKISIPLFSHFIKEVVAQDLSQTKQKIIFDPNTNEIIKGNLILSDTLTSSEFKLLRFLLQNSERLVEREEIINTVWADAKSTAGVTDQALDQLIFRVRRKIEENPNNPIHLQTVKGRGFRFTP